MKRTIKLSLTILTAALLTGCFISAGTHGSLKAYRYSATKAQLSSTIMSVIKSNPAITRDPDTINTINFILDNTNGKPDTTFKNYYNDGINYLTIKIKTGKGQNNYIFRYFGDTEFWKTSTISEIFICYAYDESGKGGSEGNGGVDTETLNYLTDVFEKELINKVDKQLGLKHAEEK